MSIPSGYNVPRETVEAFIVNAARERGIDPNVALTVYRREGAGGWQSSVVKNGVREPSWGPYQLYTGGGLGNKFQKETGLDPRDPNTWQKNITFALDEAKKGGWGPWYGAKAAGITGFAGINGAPAQMAAKPAQSKPPQMAQPQQANQLQPMSLESLIPMVMAQQSQQQQPPPTQMGILGDVPAPPPPPMMAQPKPNLTTLAALLQDAPPAVRGLLLQG